MTPHDEPRAASNTEVVDEYLQEALVFIRRSMADVETRSVPAELRGEFRSKVRTVLKRITEMREMLLLGGHDGA